MKKEIYEPLAKKIREYIPELVHTPKHSGDTGFFYPINLKDALQALNNKDNNFYYLYFNNEILAVDQFPEKKRAGYEQSLIVEIASRIYFDDKKPLELQDDEVGKILTDILINSL